MNLSNNEQSLIDELDIAPETKIEIITNPYSKKQIGLDSRGVALYDYIKGCEITCDRNISLAKLVFAKLYPDEYMALVD